MDIDTPTLQPEGLQRFQALRGDAVDAVARRFLADHDTIYARFGQRGRQACREDLAFHLEFLRPVLEFGLIQPMVDYLRWLANVLATRDVPADHLPRSLDWLAEFYAANLEGLDADIVVTALHRARKRYLEADDSMPAIYAMMPARWEGCDAFEAALLAGDRRTAGALFDRSLEGGRGLVASELHLIQPALYGIGRKWQENKVSVAQEHLATAISQALMTQGLSKAGIPASNGRSVLLACVEGNKHSLGLQMVADAFQLAGWDVQYLGANVPTGALVQQAGEYRPDLVGLSVSFAQQLRGVKDVISRLTQALGAGRPPVIIGGLAINQFDRLAGQLGADAWSPDARSAVISASNLSTPASPS